MIMDNFDSVNKNEIPRKNLLKVVEFRNPKNLDSRISKFWNFITFGRFFPRILFFYDRQLVCYYLTATFMK
jgi:hypothetical protein